MPTGIAEMVCALAVSHSVFAKERIPHETIPT